MISEAVIVMLSTTRYPQGRHEHRGKSMVTVGEWPWGHAEWATEPPPSLSNGARFARAIDPEDFGGALIPLHALELVEKEHGGRNPLGWVRGNAYFRAAEGQWSPAVYVYAGDFLVAIVSPLADSPCVTQSRPS